MELKPQKRGKTLAEAVCSDYGSQLQRYLIGCLRHAQNARDLEQEVYLRLLRVPPTELVHNPQGYVYRIAAHVVHEFRMRARRERVTFNSEMVERWSEEPPAVSLDQLGEQLSSKQQLERMLSQLHPAYRAAFILHKRDGLSRSEVAKALGLSVHTVKKYIFRAVSTLRSAKWDL